MQQNKKRVLAKIINYYTVIGVLFCFIAAILIFIPILPTIVYNIYPTALANERESLTLNLENDKLGLPKEELPDEEIIEVPVDTRPPFDPSLSDINTISIAKFEINSEIYEGEDPNAALDLGPWRVGDFGNPEDNEIPIIIASHRWGVIGWSNEERRNKSFVRLPELEVGDQIEIIWNQRKYIYEVYAGENGESITDYDADLILYTCQFYWPSPERIFRYAKRVN